MNYKSHSLLLILLLITTACSTAIPLTEPNIRENILGEWRYDAPDAPLDFAHWFIFKHEAGTENGGECRSSRGNGIWNLSGNTLHIEIVDERFPLEGINARYTVLSLTNKQLVLKNVEDTETYSLKRPER